MLAGPNVMLMNIMACRVFRKTKFAPLSYCTQQSMLSAPNIVMAPMDHRSARIPSFASSKLYTRGDGFNGTFNITVDISTGEHGVEHITAAEHPKIFSSVDNAERGHEA